MVDEALIVNCLLEMTTNPVMITSLFDPTGSGRHK
jgi:hypothetical protein